MVRTVRRTILRSQLAYTEIQASARTCGRSAADSMIQNAGFSKVKSVYFNHPSQGNSTNYYIILDLTDKAAPPTSQQIGQFPPKRVSIHPIIHFSFYFFLIHRRALCSQPVRDKVRRTGQIFPEHVERSFLDPKYSSTKKKNRTIRESKYTPN